MASLYNVVKKFMTQSKFEMHFTVFFINIDLELKLLELQQRLVLLKLLHLKKSSMLGPITNQKLRSNL